MTETRSKALQRIRRWLWLALLVVLPITSFPIVQRTIGGETVSPLSLLPLLLLLILGFLPHMMRGGRLPAEAWPLLLFFALAAFSTVTGLFLSLEPYKAQTVLSRSIRGASTLAVGISFYLVAALSSQEDSRLRESLQAISLGAVLTLLWSSIQASYVLGEAPSAPWGLNQIHRLFSVRDLLDDRVTGLAYEPSWLGNQLVMIYMPLWLGGMVAGWPAFGKEGHFPWVELALALWGSMVLALAKSRISTASLVLMLGVLGLWRLWRLGERVLQRWSKRSAESRLPSWLPRFGAIFVGLLSAWGLIAGFLILSAKYDWRVRRILSLPKQLPAIQREYPYQIGYAVADRIAFAERLVYWRAGLAPFEAYPLLGVGLGNAGFLFAESVPDYGYQLVEIRNALDPLNENFPNPKNLWIRILSETGFVGMAAFLTWIAVMACGAYALRGQLDPKQKALGAAGLLALVAWLLEGFSLDTFALPHPWILFGLLTAEVWRARRHLERSMPRAAEAGVVESTA